MYYKSFWSPRKFSTSIKPKLDYKSVRVEIKDDDYEMHSSDASMDLSQDEDSEYEETFHPNESPKHPNEA